VRWAGTKTDPSGHGAEAHQEAGEEVTKKLKLIFPCDVYRLADKLMKFDGPVLGRIGWIGDVLYLCTRVGWEGEDLCVHLLDTNDNVTLRFDGQDIYKKADLQSLADMAGVALVEE
jgi:hypothetical protein